MRMFTRLVLLDQVGKEFDKTQNPLAHHVGSLAMLSRPRVWKRLNCVGHSVISPADFRRRRCDQRGEGCVPVQFRTGVG